MAGGQVRCVSSSSLLLLLITCPVTAPCMLPVRVTGFSWSAQQSGVAQQHRQAAASVSLPPAGFRQLGQSQLYLRLCPQHAGPARVFLAVCLFPWMLQLQWGWAAPAQLQLPRCVQPLPDTALGLSLRAAVWQGSTSCIWCCAFPSRPLCSGVPSSSTCGCCCYSCLGRQEQTGLLGSGQGTRAGGTFGGCCHGYVSVRPLAAGVSSTPCRYQCFGAGLGRCRQPGGCHCKRCCWPSVHTPGAQGPRSTCGP